MALDLRNPHSVLAAIEARPRDVLEIRLNANQPAGYWGEVAAAAERQGIAVRRGAMRESSGRRQKRSSGGTERIGAAEATLRERSDVPLDELFAEAESGKPKAESGASSSAFHAPRSALPPLWLALDCLQDPHNVGAIFRTAAFYGVQGIVVTKDRSAPLNATVYDIASGGMEYVPFSIQPNLSRALEQAKQAGLWVLGTSERAEKDIADVPRDRPWLLVLGNEEKGLRRLTLEHCDEVCRLSPRGGVTSLNVSVAAGILVAALSGVYTSDE